MFCGGVEPAVLLLMGVWDWTEGERGEAYEGMDGLGWLVGVSAGDCIGLLILAGVGWLGMTKAAVLVGAAVWVWCCAGCVMGRF